MRRADSWKHADDTRASHARAFGACGSISTRPSATRPTEEAQEGTHAQTTDNTRVTRRTPTVGVRPLPSAPVLKVERGVTRERAVRANDVLGPVHCAAFRGSEGTQLGATGRALSPMIVPRFSRLAVGAAAALLHAAGSATPARCTLSKHDQAQKAKLEAQRARQYAEAIAWCKCKEDDKRTAYAAERRLNNHGNAFWPDISKDGLARRIKGEVNNDRPWAKVGVLTPLEEADLVETCKMLNLHGQGTQPGSCGPQEGIPPRGQSRLIWVRQGP
eukprot:scaffold1932_cov162-Isochrysis_galbana.AAC.2